MTAADKPGIRRRLSAVEVKLVPVLLVLLLLGSAALTAWLYLSWYRPDKQTDSSAAGSVMTAARDGTVALLSYTPQTVDADMTTAKSHLTGDFLSYFDEFTQKVVAPAAKEKGLKTTADIVGAAMVDMHPDSAVVLLFVNQTTTSKERPDPSMTASSIQVSLSKVDGTWLIAKFDPV